MPYEPPFASQTPFHTARVGGDAAEARSTVSARIATVVPPQRSSTPAANSTFLGAIFNPSVSEGRPYDIHGRPDDTQSGRRMW